MAFPHEFSSRDELAVLRWPSEGLLHPDYHPRLPQSLPNDDGGSFDLRVGKFLPLVIGCFLLGAPAWTTTDDSCFANGITAVEVAVNDAEWKKALRLADRLDRRIIFRAAKRKETCLRPGLARLAAFRAIALVSSGKLEKALWLWEGAKALDAEQLPDLELFPLAQALTISRPAANGQPPEGGLTSVRTRNSSIPRLLNLSRDNGLSGRAQVTGYFSTEGLPIRVEFSASNALLAYIVIDLCSELPRPSGVASSQCSHTF